MDKRTRVKLIAAAIVLAAGSVAAVAWHESRFPLRYLETRRVHMAAAHGVQSRRSRDLVPEEIDELCRLLRSARLVEDFDGRRTLRVELRTVDYGRVNVHDFEGPGANLHVQAGEGAERTCTVRSGALGALLARLSAELNAPAQAGAVGSARR